MENLFISFYFEHFYWNNLILKTYSHIITLIKLDIDMDMAPCMHIIIDMNPLYTP